MDDTPSRRESPSSVNPSENFLDDTEIDKLIGLLESEENSDDDFDEILEKIYERVNKLIKQNKDRKIVGGAGHDGTLNDNFQYFLPPKFVETPLDIPAGPTFSMSYFSLSLYLKIASLDYPEKTNNILYKCAPEISNFFRTLNLKGDIATMNNFQIETFKSFASAVNDDNSRLPLKKSKHSLHNPASEYNIELLNVLDTFDILINFINTNSNTLFNKDNRLISKKSNDYLLQAVDLNPVQSTTNPRYLSGFKMSLPFFSQLLVPAHMLFEKHGKEVKVPIKSVSIPPIYYDLEKMDGGGKKYVNTKKIGNITEYDFCQIYILIILMYH